jgi:hypothetical protein
MKIIITTLLILQPLFLAARSFDDIFPDISAEQKAGAFSVEKVSTENAPAETYSKWEESPKNTFLVESIFVLPLSQSESISINDRYTIDLFNSLQYVRLLKGRTYHSFTRNRVTALFLDAYRIENADSKTPIPDPDIFSELPESQTIFIVLKDVNFGDTYYRNEMTKTEHGINYKVTNYKKIKLFLLTVFEAEQFNANMYLEIIDEGILVHSTSKAVVSPFVSSQVDMPSAIRKRMNVLVEWFKDSLSHLRRDFKSSIANC